MKKNILLLAVVFASMAYAQVGIKTTTPRDALDVNGNILLESYIILPTTNTATGNYNLLVRSTDSNPIGEVKKLNVLTRNVGPANKYTVKISNVNDQKVIKLNTNLDVNKYYVGGAEAVFSGANIMSNGTQGSPAFPIHGTYFTSVEASPNGKYVVSLNFNGAATQNAANGTWDLSFIVFEKTLVKDWGIVTGNVNSNHEGVSTNTPLGLQ